MDEHFAHPPDDSNGDPATLDPVAIGAEAARHLLRPDLSVKFSDEGGPYDPGEASRTIPAKQQSEVAVSAAEQRASHLEDELVNERREKADLVRRLQHTTADLRASEEGAARDPQTGLWNKVAFQEIVEPKAARYGGVLLILDVDHFKQVNDQLGHDAGDHVLNEIAEILKENTRPEDDASRFGGEEFCVYVPGDHGTSMEIATRLQNLINKIKFPDDQPVVVPARQPDTTEIRESVGLSIGMADYSPGARFADVFKSADAALYAAKERGRNQIVPDWEVQRNSSPTS